METDCGTIGLGTIGFGGFAQFAIEQFIRTNKVQLRGIAGSQRQAAFEAARKMGIPPPQSPEELVQRKDIDMVYIATPPYLHHQQALLALRAGKHVIVEKPLAICLQQADEMIHSARQRNLLLAVNQMQRYSPLAESIGGIVAAGTLGQVLHGTFENYASDQGLPPEHWFWDRAKSGGIFIEHGVHFFDLMAGWLGEAQVAAAQRSIRPETGVEEQVQCTVRYGRTTLVNFYHGFHQAGVMDRQELRLMFERGDITLYDWIPRYGRAHVLVNEPQANELLAMLPNAEVVGQRDVAREVQGHRARHQEISADRVLDIMFSVTNSEQSLYAECLRAFLVDQLAWIDNHNHARKVTAQNGRDALAIAMAATELADAEQQHLPPPRPQHHKS